VKPSRNWTESKSQTAGNGRMDAGERPFCRRSDRMDG
jgi:hypothetical protein